MFTRAKNLFSKLKTFEIDQAVAACWKREPSTAKLAFVVALIVGFVSHMFIYTNRYYGNHDLGTILRLNPLTSSGRWFQSSVNYLSFGYVIPLTTGLFVAFFLGLAAYYVCKILAIEKTVNAVLIGALMATFPSISDTNLYLYDTSSIHLAVLLSVLAVYVTLRYKYGCAAGALLLFFALTIYQAKANVAVALCLFYLLKLLLAREFAYKKLFFALVRLAILTGGGGVRAFALPYPPRIVGLPRH
ncbi:MAG: glucosyltransferase domain-containing protein [Lachnospiraceae bacterium]|jgi:hypothetical protein|nr:glucosyltransferase domain-containing protein [Lachnospiraceae bacterium]